MYSKVIYVVKSDLHYYPPCVSQIRFLNKIGVDIEVWYGTSNQSALDIFDREGIKYICLEGANKGNSFFSKINNWIKFRNKFKKRLSLLKRKSVNKELIWYGTTETAIPLIGIVGKTDYILTSLELLDDDKNTLKRKLFGVLAHKAKAIVSCEETRSYIMKYWYNLPKLPYTMPNKPYSLGVEKYTVPSTLITSEAIERIKDKKVIIYQGIFQNIEYMTELAKALKNMNSDYHLVMMGFDTHNTNIIKILKDIYDKVVYIKSIPAPLHLEVTSHATIGLVFYDADTLNKAFCAPNKIYEYSGFGIPMIANNIPGLKNTVGKARAAVCTEFNSLDLEKAIKLIDSHYVEYSKNALDFYNSTDNEQIIRRIVEDLNIGDN